MPVVHVVGSLNADQLLELTDCPEAGETVLASDVRLSAGGKGGNQAVAAARAGAEVVMVGAVGDDAHGRLVRAELDGSGVDARRVRTVEGAPTGTAIVLLDGAGENRIVVSPGANSRLTVADVESGLRDLGEGDVLLLQLEIPSEVVVHAAHLGKRRGARVVLNAAPAPERADCLGAGLDHLVVNRGEMCTVAQLLGLADELPPAEPARAATGLDALPALVARVADSLACTVVCTAGADGAYVCGGAHGATAVHIPAVPVTATDTTAAGDTYAGYLAADLAAGQRQPATALARASAAAALTVTRPGAMDSIPRADELPAAFRP
ncbi:ribokinase [Streptomyces sp. XM4193]|uniref:ribokinase n=1 Tax=Streptomyces sp. XM4193 TaxID=2929782 RepID=UPI001FF7FD77|nr:ribokinase [Streptomyces sp. XM4193]MCK1795384.1 ribokinase [Streptomyces sp. XM4193]